MLFNSIDFAIFLPIVFIIYWWSSRFGVKIQNLILIGASIVFYGAWDIRFLLLLAVSIFTDYGMASKIYKSQSESRRTLCLLASLAINIGLLGFFKYYNFFIYSFVETFSFIGLQVDIRPLHLILPVGISFYTFQTMSYTIDVYRRKMAPSSDLLNYAAFVSFFPQLVAGPIERANNFLPQFGVSRTFDKHKAADGMRQILWGLFKKIVIADNCAFYVDYIFEHSAEMNGSSLALGAFFFSVQIYADFSGYSDIAIGLGRLFGFDLMKNFNFPYFSRNILQFWRRWHISLTSWFRDYVYISIGGNRKGNLHTCLNIMVVFLISGLWHGANWTFVVWGVLHALLFFPIYFLQRGNSRRNDKLQSRYWAFGESLITFLLVTLLWIVFRADSLTDAWNYITRLCTVSVFEWPNTPFVRRAIGSLILVVLFFGIEWHGRKFEFGIAGWKQLKSRPLRWTFYSLILFLIGMFITNDDRPFIYFQF